MTQFLNNRLLAFLQRRKYELLLFGLLQHLFIGIVLPDMHFYMEYIWPLNMLIVGLSTTGFFVGRKDKLRILRFIMFIMIVISPFVITAVRDVPFWMFITSMLYVFYFTIILWEVFRFLIRPGYINRDIISAAGCGYLLLIEMSSFLLQAVYYIHPESFKGIDSSVPATIYMDFVYFSSVTLTSIGFGDIVPSAHYTKLLTSLFGIAGQFYTVVLVGILISKFSSNRKS